MPFNHKHFFFDMPPDPQQGASLLQVAQLGQISNSAPIGFIYINQFLNLACDFNMKIQVDQHIWSQPPDPSAGGMEIIAPHSVVSI